MKREFLICKLLRPIWENGCTLIGQTLSIHFLHLLTTLAVKSNFRFFSEKKAKILFSFNFSDAFESMEAAFENQKCGILFCNNHDAFLKAKIIILALFMAIGVPANFIILYVSVMKI